MMDWREQGILLSRRRHGESAAIIEVFTEGHGRHAGIVRGGGGRRMAPVLEPGNQVDVTWRARLEDHLGTFTVEPVQSRAAALMADRKTLAGLNALTALLSFALPEREAHGNLYQRTLTVLEMMEQGPFWPLAYLRWELSLLEDLGFGLDLTRCAATGAKEDLAYVSPRTGRAVSRIAGEPYKDRLYRLPSFLVGGRVAEADREDVAEGLRQTGHFLERHLFGPFQGRLPDARYRLVERLARQA